MTEEEKLIALKAMVGGSDSDEVLSTYLKLAGRKIINRAYANGGGTNEVVEMTITIAPSTVISMDAE